MKVSSGNRKIEKCEWVGETVNKGEKCSENFLCLKSVIIAISHSFILNFYPYFLKQLKYLKWT